MCVYALNIVLFVSMFKDYWHYSARMSPNLQCLTEEFTAFQYCIPVTL